ncbi:S-adenosylmethionine decarboxylase [Sporothrix schenckii 1099-18]|uniref:S-adenosylmethionine decarboxylase n=1 Tax=Sporothrix schenckii 1099-18 TaxID=1397361 RepID=A0A0F2MEI7_SPOSC|nr:S-adenosylmethionine decarboxylase [Sporothrix schenckii 1099-18]KJR88042.1 S-adenosylmethionine decarboxylase [Sporothrix schenckii 1099-18]
MVALDIPNGCTLSPSLATPHLLGTPHLHINHDVAADLDSSNAFEGPEKLLEVWFAPSPKALAPSVKENGLKSVPADVWVEMLDLVNCKILSVIHSETVDAYLLSESSMFVFPHKIILKTCGTTTLLLGLHRMLRIAATVAGFPFHNAVSANDIRAAATPYRVFYSRKNFLFPDRQQGPHRSWKQEVKYLDDMFEGGSAYMVGKMNGDHWYLYITSPTFNPTPPQTPVDKDSNAVLGSLVSRSNKIPTGILATPADRAPGDHASAADDEDKHDETLEILMTDLDPENAKQFYLSNASAVAHDRILSQTDSALLKAATASKQQQQQQHGHGHGLVQQDSHMSDSTYSVLDSEDLFDVDDIAVQNAANGNKNDNGACSSGGSLTPLSEHLDSADMEALTTEGHALGTVVSDSCGLSDVYPQSVYPDARIDAYMFAPCGFSANGVIPAPPADGDAVASSTTNGEIPETAETAETASVSTSDSGPTSAQGNHYFTVHVTPEPNCSFASFETNVPGGQKGRQTADIVKHVVDIFRPGRFSVTLFEAKGTSIDSTTKPGGSSGKRLERIPGYRRIDRIVHDFEDYDLVFRFFEREGFVSNGEARVGEL